MIAATAFALNNIKTGCILHVMMHPRTVPEYQLSEFIHCIEIRRLPCLLIYVLCIAAYIVIDKEAVGSLIYLRRCRQHTSYPDHIAHYVHHGEHQCHLFLCREIPVSAIILIQPLVCRECVRITLCITYSLRIGPSVRLA